MSSTEPTTIGATDQTHAKLRRLRDDGHFKEMMDAYKFGIALALASGIEPKELSKTQTIFSVATIDPDQKLKTAVEAILGEQIDGRSVYRVAEQLADWGIQELYLQAANGEIDVVAILEQLEKVNDEI